MLKQFTIFLPSTVCLIWFIIMMTSANKSRTKKRLIALALLGVLFFYFQAMFAGFTIRPEDYPYINICRKVVNLLLFPTGIIYFQSLIGTEHNSPLLSIMMFPSVFLIGALTILYTMMGPEVRVSFCTAILAGQNPPQGFDGRIFELYQLFSHILYRGLIYLYFAISIFLVVRYFIHNRLRIDDISAFIFRGKEAMLVNVIVTTLMILILSFLICNILEPLLAPDSVLTYIIFFYMSALLFFFFYLGAIFDEMTVFWHEIFSPRKTWERRYLDTHPEIAGIKKAMEKGEEKNPKGFSLLNRFLIYIEEFKPYLNPDTTIEEAADHIAADKERLAKVIKESTGVNFRRYMNEKRVEEAKKLMTGFPGMPLNIIAEKSGFTSSSTFSRKFNEIEGVSPSEWLKIEENNK